MKNKYNVEILKNHAKKAVRKRECRKIRAKWEQNLAEFAKAKGYVICTVAELGRNYAEMLPPRLRNIYTNDPFPKKIVWLVDYNMNKRRLEFIPFT